MQQRSVDDTRENIGRVRKETCTPPPPLRCLRGMECCGLPGDGVLGLSRTRCRKLAAGEYYSGPSCARPSLKLMSFNWMRQWLRRYAAKLAKPGSGTSDDRTGSGTDSRHSRKFPQPSELERLHKSYVRARVAGTHARSHIAGNARTSSGSPPPLVFRLAARSTKGLCESYAYDTGQLAYLPPHKLAVHGRPRH